MTDCIFCKIIAGTIPCKKVYETEEVLAFYDIAPAAAVHVLIIPKKHVASHNGWEVQDRELLGALLLAAQEVARITGVDQSGYRLINNCGSDGGQVVHHWHLHLLGGEPIGAMNAKELK